MVDELWNRYGERIIELACRELDDDLDRVEAACVDVMVAVSRVTAVPDDSWSEMAWWSWLRAVTEAACRRIRDVDAVPTPTLAGRLLAADLGIRDRIVRRHGAFALVALAARRCQRALEGAARSVRVGVRRAEVALVNSTSAGGPSANALVGGGVALSEAAAVLAAVVAITIVGPGPASATAGGSATERITYVANRIALDDRAVDVRSGDPSVSGDRQASAVTAANGQAPATGPAPSSPSWEHAPPAEPSTADIEAAPLGVSPQVSVGPEKVVSEPVQERHHENGVEFSTPEERMTIDLNDDGKHEASFGTPGVAVECDRRDPGSVLGATCPALDLVPTP